MSTVAYRKLLSRMTFLPQDNKVTRRTQVFTRHFIAICRGKSITFVLGDFVRRKQLKTYKMK